MLPPLRFPLVATVAFLAAALARAETPTKPLVLLNGKDFAGWDLVAEPATDITTICKYNADGALAVAGKPVSFLATKASYENYRLHAEWRWTGPAAGNSGILLHIASGPKDRAWPVCHQMQLKNKAVGDMIPMAGASFAEPFTTPPNANPSFRAKQGADSEKPAGEWNSADIVCRGDTIEVTINGVAQNKVTKVSPSRGQVGFQLEGQPYEIRNVRLEPLAPAIGASYQTDPRTDAAKR